MSNFKAIEKKWQSKWERSKVFEVKEKGKKYYALEMFPYPSGSGLHMGHAFNYTIGDIYARYKRMNGFNVLHPIGYDSLGLPAENAAIKEGIHPKKYTEDAIENFEKQLRALGISYDWKRQVRTHDAEYYKWDQWIFLKLLEKGLAYRKKSLVNYCPKCNTVLANEQVHDGKCWRHTDTEIKMKEMEQWFFKITKYSEELYDTIDKLKGWPEDVKLMQKNWINKSYGTFVDFKLMDSNEKIKVFTTRPDTLFGVTFIVFAPEHPRVLEFVEGTSYESDVKNFINKVVVKEKYSRAAAEQEKEGMFIGKYVINPVNGDKIPIYIANFVLMEYGTGVVMAVPAHDQRDFEFAKKYDIPIKIVIKPKDRELKELKSAYVDEGVLVNSGEFDKLPNYEAMAEINRYLESKGLGKQTIQYRLRDWLISRQRYWGTPIPIIYCKKCGVVAVPEEDLPVKLPEKVRFGKGNPLETNKGFVDVRCPKCNGKARRETDTMDTFVNSSWYFLRYCDPKNNKQIFDKKKVNFWMPIDLYIGGKEHACMHLIYFRFYTKFLRDLGLLDLDEPCFNLFNQGMVHGSDGFVMSKSRGNVINPLEMIDKYSADILRFYLVSNTSPDKDFIWSQEGIEGSSKFINKLFNYFKKVKIGKSSKRIESKINKAIKEVTNYIEKFEYNLAIIKLRNVLDSLEDEASRKDLESFLKLLSPFCPHITEELWNKLKNKTLISSAKWPSFDAKKIDEKLDVLEELESKVRGDLEAIKKLIKFKPKKVKIFVAEKWKYELFKKLSKETEDREMSKVIKKVMIKGHEKEIVGIVKFVMKDKSRIPKIMFSQKEEIDTLKKIDFGLQAEILESKGEKQALPGKPAIIFEK